MAQLFEFAGNHPFLVGSLVLIIVLVIVNEIRLKAGGPELAPADAVRLINDGATVLDVRSATQYANGHIVGARNLPLNELGAKLDTVSNKKDKPVLVYCEMGNTSAKAAATPIAPPPITSACRSIAGCSASRPKRTACQLTASGSASAACSKLT